MKLIVQIPAFNEEQTIAATLKDIPKKIEGITSVETLVIDDGSYDNTAEAARKAGATHIVQLKSHRGLSSAFGWQHVAASKRAAIDQQADGGDRLVGSARTSADVVLLQLTYRR